MAKVQNLQLRGKTYWYHRYIPQDVRILFSGEEQVWSSLRTKDFNEAKRLCLQLTLDHDEKITAYRTGQQEVTSSEAFTKLCYRIHQAGYCFYGPSN